MCVQMNIFIGPNKQAFGSHFLIPQSKHMFWVIKRTISIYLVEIPMMVWMLGNNDSLNFANVSMKLIDKIRPKLMTNKVICRIYTRQRLTLE